MLRLCAAVLTVSLLLFAGSAQALVVDAINGDSGEFFWTEGVGSDVCFGALPCGDPAFDQLEISLSAPTQIGVFAVVDCCVVGESFFLVVDGSQTPWSSESLNGGGNFSAQRSGLFLDAGDHTIDLIVATAAPGFNIGGGTWRLSSAIPEPSSALLACVGALLLHRSCRRRGPIH